MTYLIGISGPPRAGKDTLGSYLAAHIEDRFKTQPQVAALSWPMRQTVFAMLGMYYNQPVYERDKDKPQPALGGGTIRQAMIALSEEFVKPRWGAGYWGRALLNRRWASNPKFTIVTDMGFDAEREVFEERFGARNCMWVQVTRPGYTYAKDSRHFVGNDLAIKLDNPGVDLEWFPAAARLVGDVIEHWGWVS